MTATRLRECLIIFLQVAAFCAKNCRISSNMKITTHTLMLASPLSSAPPAKAHTAFRTTRRVEKMALMSHKISTFQLFLLVKKVICAATRGVRFWMATRGRKFCQNRAKNLDISAIFSTPRSRVKTCSHACCLPCAPPS